ncbi:unnamed protein product [Allacma fusca]|uniref:Uncharacterized protein n=1 Tax=Allacma fusca TaxID=39272 RepID=A0A8J2K102_9HEXA|nr:unnamed protein product [Allacma fusca]
MILLFLIPSSIWSNFIFLIIFLIFPHQPQYIFAYTNFSKDSLLEILPFALEVTWQQFHATFTAYFFVYTSVIFEKSIDTWLKAITYDAEALQVHLGGSSEILKIYRCLQLLKALHNRAYRKIVTPVFFGCSMSLMIFAFYGTIRFYVTIPIPGYLIAPVCFLTVLTFCVLLHQSSGIVYESSQRFLQSQKKHHGNLKEKKTLESLYALRVYVNDSYFVRQSTFVSFMDVFASSAMSLLIAF